MKASLPLLLIISLFACKPSAGSAAEAPRMVGVEEAGRLTKDDGWRVLDVRTPEEFAGGYIPGATNANINADDFDALVAGLPRDASYIVHCAANVPGGRGTKAVVRLEALGFKQAVELEGGFGAWAAAGAPVEKPASP